MQNAPVIAVDVGGTTVSAGCVIDGSLRGSVHTGPSRQGCDAAGITAAIAEVVAAVRDEPLAEATHAALIAVAVPAPFDYARGISHMEHKFAAWNGTDVAALLRNACGCEARFVNDADAFAIGAAAGVPPLSRVVGITLGSGVGSGFVVAGQVVTQGEGVPPQGEVWNLPAPRGFDGAIFEDHVSRRSLEAEARAVTGDAWEVRDIAAEAETGASWAVGLFAAYGRALGAGLGHHVAGFRPEAIVFGGGIAKAFSLFDAQVRDAYTEVTGTPPPLLAADTEGVAALIGAWRLATGA